ncbi:B12-binding domain-containing radical SAM protein [Mucilaginibacter agri]|uniref:Radical SAM protein n=1 Tax=Mucilaginibacter agri TaxID=2695265 RepID=A0A966DT83_9SPHI|nr:radical SAM protein [Mucilaginibacter agri]NCD69052.1 radical SAM protein [Mucilaginibacter agri]
MAAHVLLTHSYFLRFDKKQWQIGQPYAPLATLYAASILRDRDYEVTFFDTMFAHCPDDVAASIQTRPDYFVIYDDGFNYLTKMCLTNMREAAFEMCKMAKAQGCTVIVSSSDSTDRYKEYLNEGADYVLIGEADETLPELIEALSSEELFNPLDIAGISFILNGAPVKSTPRKVIKDLDHLPFAAWDLIDITPYRNAWLKSKGYFSMNMSTTRGCPFKCNWCAKPIYGNRYNSRSPEHVVKELTLMQRMFKFDHIWFCDDIFGLKPGWVQTFADLIEQSGLQFKFKIQSRADLLLEDAEVASLERAGCENAWIGAESGSQKILDAMDKGTTIEQIHKATALLKKHNIHPSFFIQFGYPSETKEDIGKTVQMINQLLPYEIGISVSYPLPGTVFFDRVKEQLKDKTNWTDSDEMALMFRNTYPPAFYKQLHKYVHRNYHRHLARAGMLQLLRSPLAVDTGTIKKALSIIYYLPATWLEKIKLNNAETA